MKINSNIDAATLSEAFRRAGRMQIPDFLDGASAAALYQEMQNHRAWNFVIFAHGKHIDLGADGWQNLDQQKKQQTIQIVHERANLEFAYMHYKSSIYDRYHAGTETSPVLTEWFRLWNGDFLDFARTLTGAEDIGFTDAQMTAMGPGHFITKHNDDLEGKNRRAAYVLNMTEDWREDWGGYLNLYDANGNITNGFKPAYNALNIFTVPADHSVGVVAPFAAKPRMVISGWLRAGPDPAAAGASAG